MTRLGAASIIGIAMMATAQPAAGDTPPTLTTPTISGSPFVGETLTAATQATGDPAPTLAYQWLRCAPDKDSCDQIGGATEPSYVVPAAMVGRRLAIRVRARNKAGTATAQSALTEIVTTPPPPPPPPPAPTPTPVPTPTPTPTPTPSPTPGEADTPLRFDQSSPSQVAPALDAPGESTATVELMDDLTPYLRPFPVVRITGTLVPGGARVSRLRVRAPATARVVVRCRGGGCRFFSRSTGSSRIHELERVLRSGTRITIRVTRPDTIGKHVLIVIRDGSAPRRRDACLMPGSTRPVRCPVP